MAEPTPPRRRFGARLRAALWKNLLVLALLEGLVRVAAGLGWLSLPPIEVSGFDRGHAEHAGDAVRLFAPDLDLIVRMRPHVAADYPRAVTYGEAPRSFHVETNARGYRTPPFELAKPPGVIRVVCLGDSSTFGMNVEADDSYPRRLAALLDERHPGRFEVINLGVPGYSSRQGLEQLRREALGLAPDVVTFAFGTNDLFWHRPLTDDQVIRLNQSRAGRLIFWTRGALDHLYLYRLMRQALPLLVQRSGDAPQLSTTRSTPEGISEAVVAAQALLAPSGVPLLVLNTDFYQVGAGQPLRDGAARAGSRFVDLVEHLADERTRRARELAQQLGLPPAPRRDGHLTFRVLAREPNFVHLRLRRYMRPELTVAMLDNGMPPDQVADDRVWTVEVEADPGEVVGYTYLRGLKPPFTKEFHDASGFTDIERRARLRDGGVDVFGDPLLLSDPTHPNEEGDRLIAARLADEILRLPQVQARLR
ncbi:MAG: SGNH/GDSL hydrolase family protein [Deltaproteobacteria bacterium]|nr:SGNH/GDSL hydrolase family protein [Deltaproteobacteria bacterium]